MLVTAGHRDVGETISMLLTLWFKHLHHWHLLSLCTCVQSSSTLELTKFMKASKRELINSIPFMPFCNVFVTIENLQLSEDESVWIPYFYTAHMIPHMIWPNMESITEIHWNPLSFSSICPNQNIYFVMSNWKNDLLLREKLLSDWWHMKILLFKLGICQMTNWGFYSRSYFQNWRNQRLKFKNFQNQLGLLTNYLVVPIQTTQAFGLDYLRISFVFYFW